MPFFECKVCRHQLEAKLSPFSCPSCGAKGKGFNRVEAAPPPPAPVAAPPPTPVPVPVVSVAATPPVSSRCVWRFPATATPGQLPQRNTFVVDAANHRFYVAWQSKLLAFETSDSGVKPLWEYATAGQIPGSPVLGGDGVLRVHSFDGYLHLVNSSGQRACDPIAVGEPLTWAAPLVDARNNTWICGSQGGLYRVEATGAKPDRPFLRSREKFDCTGLIHRDVLYLGASNACLFSIPLTEPRGRNQWNPVDGQGKTGWYINATPALLDAGTVLVASRDDHLNAFRLTGELAWTEALPGQLLGSPVVASGGIYCGLTLQRRGSPNRGLLIRMDASTHRIQWQYPTDAPVESTPVVAGDGAVYCGDNCGMLHAVDSAGQSKWKENLGVAIRSPGALLSPQLVAFGLENGQLMAARVD